MARLSKLLALIPFLSGCSTLIDLGGEAIGYAELAGLRYPVKPYSAWVVDGSLMRGSRIDTPEGYAFLKKQGFVRIIDLREEGPGDTGYGADAARLSVTRIRIPDNSVPMCFEIQLFLDRAALGKTYFHCEAGEGRTGVMAAAWRVFRQGWTPQAALDEAKKYGLKMPNQEAAILRLRDCDGLK